MDFAVGGDSVSEKKQPKKAYRSHRRLWILDLPDLLHVYVQLQSCFIVFRASGTWAIYSPLNDMLKQIKNRITI